MPTADIVITRRLQPSQGWNSHTLSDIWAYRELLYFFIWRDIEVRYKQTLLGAGWAIIQPLMTMVVFTIFFGHLAEVPSDGIPYPVFAGGALALDLFRVRARGLQHVARRLSAHHLEGVLPPLIFRSRGGGAARRFRDRLRHARSASWPGTASCRGRRSSGCPR